MRPFLTARWTNLALLSYPVPDDLLQPLLPPGLTLDRHEGSAFVSFVAFDFLDTRVLGIRWPGFVNFPEINLRFYVREGERRGVVFVRELVPSRLVAAIARLLYNEPYRATAMQSRVRQGSGHIEVAHDFRWAGRTHHLALTADLPPVLPSTESSAHFFKEHQWGYGIDRHGRLLRYEVRHPHWQVYPDPTITDCAVDFGSVYGASWAFLNGATPASVVLAVGSEIEVYPGRRL